ncbi:MAG: hypothetical protein J6D09_04710 [Clostridia bacterium]|nr:hypothetical protein [Clostridia bacterium]
MNKRIKVLVSAVLAAVMLVLCIPFTAAAADVTGTKITTLADLTTGEYVIVSTANKVVQKLDGSWVLVGDLTNGATVTTADANVWTITVKTEGGKTYAKLTDSNGTSIAPSGGNNNGIKSGSYDWLVTVKGENFVFAGTGSDTVYLACNKGSSYKVRGYKTTTCNNDATGYPTTFVLYKVGEGSGSGSEGGNVDTPTFVKPTTPEGIVNALYSLESGATLAEGPYTLEGVVKSIDTGYDTGYKNVTVTIIVGDMTDKPVKCFRMKGDDAATVAEGDTIKVTGELKNYNGTKEFDAGCTFVTVKKAEKPFEKPTEPKDIVDALYALGKDETLPGGNYTLTGKITSIDEAYSDQYKNITLTIVVGDMTDKPIICFRLKGDGADALKVGDNITVTGTLVDYGGKKEFNSGCTFVLATAGEGGSGNEGGNTGSGNEGTQGGGNQGGTTSPDTNDNVAAYIAVAVVALFGIAYVSKKH